MQQSLQEYLMEKFRDWQPQAPTVLQRTERSVTLQWLEKDDELFGFMRDHLLYKIQRKEKIPPWVTVYSGGKTTVIVENLAPSHPHKFRLQVILKPAAVFLLAEAATSLYNNENAIHDVMEKVGPYCDEVPVIKSNESQQDDSEISNNKLEVASDVEEIPTQIFSKNKNDNLKEEVTDGMGIIKTYKTSERKVLRSKRQSSTDMWLVSQWSEETWTSTDTDGTSAMCFCMAVRCGYFKQVQVMLEERPILIDAINSISGLTPLATAVKKGDVNTVKFLISLGAQVDQPTTSSRTPLHLAVLTGHTAVADVLLEKGANFQAQDLNGLRVEHYAVDSGILAMVKHIMDKGGNVGVKDSNGWTPLFRAVCQGAKTDVIEELLYRGSSVDVTDRRGLTLVAAARLLRNRQGRSRDSVLRLVDAQFPHEKAVANFTRLTKKIYTVHTLLK